MRKIGNGVWSLNVEPLNFELPRGLERLERLERFERLRRTRARGKRSVAIERLERLERLEQAPFNGVHMIKRARV